MRDATFPHPTVRQRLVARLAGGAAAAALSVGALAAPAVAAPAPTGPDVSGWQHKSPLSWAKVKASGESFTFLKATEGASYTNPWFASDWSRSRDVGLARGAYHFARPSVGSAVAQARRFIGVAGAARRTGDLPPVLDLEQDGGLTPAQLTTWTRQFLVETRRLTGRTPILYTYPNFWRTSMAGTKAFTSYPLWIASYTRAPRPLMPPWPRWTFWQYSASSTVPGIAGKLDMNRFNGSPTALRRLANQAPDRKPGPKVTATLSASTTDRQQPVTLSGSVTPAVAGQKVYRQGYYSGAWHTWASTRVGKDGTFSFTITPTVATVNVYRVRVPATDTRKAGSSPKVSLTVR
jgi:lysozyme